MTPARQRTASVGWYKFLVSYGLFALSVYNLYECVSFASVLAFWNSNEHLYMQWHMQACILVGAVFVLRIGMAVYAVKIRKWLRYCNRGNNYNKGLSGLYLLHFGELAARYVRYFAMDAVVGNLRLTLMDWIIPAAVIAVSLILTVGYWRDINNTKTLRQYKWIESGNGVKFTRTHYMDERGNLHPIQAEFGKNDYLH